jgi:hypothetical protein
LDIKPATVRRWLDRAAERCDKVNDNMMKFTFRPLSKNTTQFIF